MRLRHRIATALALLVALLALPGLAYAGSGDAAIRDCANDGKLDKTYTQSQLADAIAHLPADVDEYSDCRDILRRAQLNGGSSGGGSSNSGGGGTTGGGATGGGGGGTGGGGTTGGGNADTGTASAGPATDPLQGATDAERAAFQKAVANGDAPVKLDGRPITPGALGGAKTNGLSDLPAPLLAILALLVVAGFGAAAFGTRRLVHGRRPA
ncbi:MAG TPA: hypothetical protein VFG42_21860 [Baekduia sp.]|uniref:hypothetical protein n=1 Tax=Baekduia sp. TaxID=2600305 RepID=UPI002D7832A2|nr:hypothetical protein [Baekduia sp.]HET6509459.1 hypothetical protein [Baekduia sp.]